MDAKQKICLSIGNVDYPTLLEMLVLAPLVELRLDLLNLSNEQLKEVFLIHSNAIATCRAMDNNPKEAVKTLSDAIDLGCAYIDIDVNTPEELLKPLVNKAKELNRKIIISYHNYSCTPSVIELENIITEIFSLNPTFAKIACLANTEVDCANMLGLYARYHSVIAFSMGTFGKITRLAAPLLGAPFTYASYRGIETAPGQLDYHEVEKFFKNYFSE